MEDERRNGEVEIEFEEPAGGEQVQPTGVEPTPQVVVEDADVQTELGRLQEEIDRLRELYLRKLADFDNYRKRQEREMTEFRRHAHGDLLRDVLPVVDNLTRALEAPAEAAQALRAGVELVLRQCLELLGRYGVKEIDPRGEPFDPSLHEAIQRVESAEVQHATVSQVMQKGYVHHDRLLRPALVVVAVPPAGGPRAEREGEVT